MDFPFAGVPAPFIVALTGPALPKNLVAMVFRIVSMGAMNLAATSAKCVRIDNIDVCDQTSACLSRKFVTVSDLELVRTTKSNNFVSSDKNAWNFDLE